MLRLLAVIAALAAMTFSAPAAAQAPVERPDQEARALFDAGSVAYSEGRYESALEHFRRAHELSGRPRLLYNIGLSAERLRRDEEALRAYRDFLEQVPDSDQREAVEARIAILDAAVAASASTRVREESESAPDAVSTAVDELPIATLPHASPDLTAPIALIATGVVVAIVGGVLLGVAAADGAAVENAERGTRWDSVSGAYSRAEPLWIAGVTALGIGAATAVGGLIWLVVPADHADATASIQVLPGLGTFALRGSF